MHREVYMLHSILINLRKRKMTRKKSWLARLEGIDQKDQSRLDQGGKFVGINTIFQPNKRRRSGKQAEKEKTIKLTFVVYTFFAIEIFILGGLSLVDSNSSSLGSAISLIVWSAILSISSLAIGITALILRPHLLYMHTPFILNCLLFLVIFVTFAF